MTPAKEQLPLSICQTFVGQQLAGRLLTFVTLSSGTVNHSLADCQPIAGELSRFVGKVLCKTVIITHTCSLITLNNCTRTFISIRSQAFTVLVLSQHIFTTFYT